MQGAALGNLVQDQLVWYKGLINVGRSMQMKSAKMDKDEAYRKSNQDEAELS